MDQEFLRWLQNERDEALGLASTVRYERRAAFWHDHYTMLAAAVEEVRAIRYKEATGK